MRATPSSAIGAGPVRVISISLRRAGPAIGKLDAWTDPVRCNQAVVSGIAVDLQDAAKALQYPFSMLPATTGGIGEDHARW
jgi:hypothetical protein